MPERTFGSVLRALRREKGLTQEELAFRSELDTTYISLLERELRNPSLNILFRLSRALGVKPEDVVAQIETGR